MEKRRRPIGDVMGDYKIIGTILAIGLLAGSCYLNYAVPETYATLDQISDPKKTNKSPQSIVPTEQAPTTIPTAIPTFPTITQEATIFSKKPINDNCENFPKNISHRQRVIYNGQEGTFRGSVQFEHKEWEIQFYTPDGTPYTLNCEQISREDVLPVK